MEIDGEFTGDSSIRHSDPRWSIDSCPIKIAGLVISSSGCLIIRNNLEIMCLSKCMNTE